MNTIDNYTTILYAGGKYLAVYLPNYIDALSDGYVYEHRLVASKILGRPLTKQEYVHHKDENGRNNDPNNLMIFASNKDHIAYHHGAEVYCKDGVYYAKEFISRQNYYCLNCGKKIAYKATRCRSCASVFSQRQKTKRPSRETLKMQLKNHNFLQLGRYYGVSDNAVRKWCRYYNLPDKSSTIKHFTEEQWTEI